MPSLDLPLLKTVLAQPTAPYREHHVAMLLKRTLAEAGVPHFVDPIGNIVIGAENERRYRALLAHRAPEPLRLFMAHMDHPGFHGVGWLGPDELSVKWHGGTPTAHLVGASVWLASESGWEGEAEVRQADLYPPGHALAGRALDTAILRVNPELPRRIPRATELFGGFRFREPVWQEGELLYTKAADDLVGAYAIVALALSLWKKKPRAKAAPPFLGLLTRAEEVGFIGAIGHFELGWLGKRRREVLCVSLETSRALPGAEIGKGPIVRLGDRATVFDPGALRVFTDLAAKALPGAHQRRIMDGGSCEATAATAYGLPSIGISVPLGNYHNQGLEGGPDSRGENGPSPEFVQLGDVQGLLTLCEALLSPKQSWADPWEARRKAFRKSLRDSGKLLKGRKW
ncbi:MAG: hypothetical protein NDJ89_17750 [Oligoflexia bacterium]|nr:hypothetical protein [Oligoflexia bacterium]